MYRQSAKSSAAHRVAQIVFVLLLASKFVAVESKQVQQSHQVKRRNAHSLNGILICSCQQTVIEKSVLVQPLKVWQNFQGS
jgi:hypothetical protein